MSKSAIGWTDYSLNPYGWACQKVSEGCKFCYAEAMAKRFNHQFNRPPEWKGDVWVAKKLARIPDGAMVFVNSYSDTFHEAAPLAWIQKIFAAAEQRPAVTFQVLTKRPHRAAELANVLPWPANLWIGTSVELAKYTGRIDHLRQIPTPNRFISFEPLLGAIGPVDLSGIGWVITGGESGRNHRNFDKQWAAQIKDQCAAQHIPFYHKQGSAFKPGQDRQLDGQIWDGFPAAFNVSMNSEPQVPIQMSMF